MNFNQRLNYRKKSFFYQYKYYVYMYILNGDKGLKRGVNVFKIGVFKIIWSFGGLKIFFVFKYCVNKLNV